MRRGNRDAKGTAVRAAGTALLMIVVWVVPTHAKTVNRIVATVDGDPITLYELKQFAARNVRGRQVESIDPAALLETVITERIIEKEFNAAGLAVRDGDVERYIDNIKERNKLTDEQLRAALEQQGITWEEYQTQIRTELQKVQLINQQVRGKVSVTPEEVERYYKAHLDEYSVPEHVEISHIVLRLPEQATGDQVAAVTARADEIYGELEKGEPFEELAKRYSEDASAEEGGALGAFKKGEMLDEFEEQVVKLKPGEYSKPFRTPVGVHIVKLSERGGASHQSLDELQEGIRERLYNEALEERYNRWLREDLRQRHHVELLQ